MSDKPGLTKLEQFPCPYCDGPTKFCKPDCLAALGGVDTNCQVVDVYRQAITDNRCARLLRVFVRRIGPQISRILQRRLYDVTEGYARHGYGGGKTVAARKGTLNGYERTLFAIRDALRVAGLE